MATPLPIRVRRGSLPIAADRAAVLLLCLFAGVAFVGTPVTAYERSPRGISDDSSDVVRVTVVPARTSVVPGEVFPVAIVLDHERRWNTQAGGPDADPESIPTSLTVTGDAERLHVRHDALQWPAAERKPLRWAGPGASVAVYSGRTVIYMPVEVRPDAPVGLADLSVAVTYQACDDMICLTPVIGQSFHVQVAVNRPGSTSDASGGATTFHNPELFTDYRAVAAQLEPVASGGGPIPVWVHATGGVLLLAAIVLGIALANGAGMSAPSAVFLLRITAVGMALVALLLWIGFATAG